MAATSRTRTLRHVLGASLLVAAALGPAVSSAIPARADDLVPPATHGAAATDDRSVPSVPASIEDAPADHVPTPTDDPSGSPAVRPSEESADEPEVVIEATPGPDEAGPGNEVPDDASVDGAQGPEDLPGRGDVEVVVPGGARDLDAEAFELGAATGAVSATPAVAGPDPTALIEDDGFVVDKAVDADGDGVFSEDEEARSATTPVTFLVTLSNTSGTQLDVLSVVDILGDQTLDLLADPACDEFATTLEPGQSASCTFTLDRYMRTWASPPRSVLTNTVEATATDGESMFTDSDEATVRNANALVVSVEVTVTTDADGDGVFSDDEQAPMPGADVPVRIEVVNTSPGAVVITGVTGTWGDGGVEDLLTGRCPALDQMKLWGAGGGDHDGGDHEEGDHDDTTHASGPDVPAAASAHDDTTHSDDTHDEPGGRDGGTQRPNSVVCMTVLEGHAPAFGSAVVETVTATVGKKHSPERTASATASARVWVAAQPTPAIDVELSVGPVGGPVRDHDEAPGAVIDVPVDGATVRFVVQVTNTGDTPLVDLGLFGLRLDLDDCALPDQLMPGESVTCDVGPLAAAVGARAYETTARATGEGRPVEDADPAHYLGVAVALPPTVVPSTPVVEPAVATLEPTTAPGSLPMPVTTTGDATAAPTSLATTGAPIGSLAIAGLALLLAGLALHHAAGVPTGPGVSRPVRIRRDER